MHLRMTKLQEITDRANLSPLANDDLSGVFIYERWPEAQIHVRASSSDIQMALARLHQDVDDVWPGRDANDGSISLLAIALESVIAARRTPPAEIVLTASGSWIASPTEVSNDDRQSVSESRRRWQA